MTKYLAEAKARGSTKNKYQKTKQQNKKKNKKNKNVKKK
jgi:hypothetical protein